MPLKFSDIQWSDVAVKFYINVETGNEPINWLFKELIIPGRLRPIFTEINIMDEFTIVREPFLARRTIRFVQALVNLCTKSADLKRDNNKNYERALEILAEVVGICIKYPNAHFTCEHLLPIDDLETPDEETMFNIFGRTY